MRSPIALVLVAIALVACGDDSREPTAAPKPAATAVPAKAAFPSELVGTWTMKLPVSAIPDTPNELIGASSRWELKVLADGGVDGAPSLTLINGNDDIGPIFSPPTVTVSGDRLKLTDPTEDCRGVPTSLAFTYAVEGDKLTLQPPDRADCPYPLIETILTTNSWRRAA